MLFFTRTRSCFSKHSKQLKDISAHLTTLVGHDTVLCDKFKGCLVGGLIGDCYGRPYKLADEVSKPQLQKYFEKLDGPYFKAPYKPFSASTALSNCLAESLIEREPFDAKDVARRFVKEFFENPHRDYGNNISHIFVKLRGSKFENPYGPASEVFLGMGSYGNSAAARVAPVALRYFENADTMVDISSKASNITNSHQLGRNGALLQSWAIRLALELGSNTLDIGEFLKKLVDRVKDFEIDEEGLKLKDVHKFQQQLFFVEKLLGYQNPTEQEVVDVLGHAKIAVYSVPTAIYCFLRGSTDIPGIETDNKFRRVVQYAVSLGGDSDTIASMAGAVAGACYGFSSIGESLRSHCEGAAQVTQLAEQLFSTSR